MFRDNTELAQRQDFIDAMHQVASSVSVVTTDGEAGRFDATVSAFSSVSADPPTVLVCLFAQSRIVLGHVRDLLTSDASPLTYHDGSYHRVLPQTQSALSAAT